MPIAKKMTRRTRSGVGSNQERKKEATHDYRYFPEPDIPPMSFDVAFLEDIQRSIPELPQNKRKRFIEQYGFNEETALLLTENQALAEWIENVISELRVWLQQLQQTQDEAINWEQQQPALIKLVAGWTTSELFKLIKAASSTFDAVKITAENFAEFLVLIYEKKINSSAAQIVLKEMFENGGDPTNIMSEKNLGQIEDDAQLELVIGAVIAENPDAVCEYQAGKTALMKFFIGKIMKATQGKANPQRVAEILEKRLSKK